MPSIELSSRHACLCGLSWTQASRESIRANSSSTAKPIRVQESRSRSQGARSLASESFSLGLFIDICQSLSITLIDLLQGEGEREGTHSSWRRCSLNRKALGLCSSWSASTNTALNKSCRTVDSSACSALKLAQIAVDAAADFLLCEHRGRKGEEGECELHF